MKLAAPDAAFLDFDGTLVDFSLTPGETTADAPLLELLRSLETHLEGRVAIVSGRPLEVLRDDFGLGHHWLAGSHGLEIAAPGGEIERPPRPPSVDKAQAELEHFAVRNPGIVVEPKSLGVGLHYRLAPDLKYPCELLMIELAKKYDLQLQHGKMMYELRPAGAHKGSAIESLLKRAPFAGGRPIFFGDDITDEDGFRTASALGGFGVLVGDLRETAARERIETVSGVRVVLGAR